MIDRRGRRFWWGMGLVVPLLVIAAHITHTLAGGIPVRVALDLDHSGGTVRATWAEGGAPFEEIEAAYSPHYYEVEVTAPGMPDGPTPGGYQFIAMAGVDEVVFSNPLLWAHVSTYFLLTGAERPATVTLKGWTIGPEPYLNFETDPMTEPVIIRSGAGPGERVALATEGRGRVIYPIETSKRCYRYVGEVPRRALRTLRFETGAPEGSAVERLYVGTWIPRVYYRDAAPARGVWGVISENWRPEWTGGAFSLSSGDFPFVGPLGAAGWSLGYGLLLLALYGGYRFLRFARGNLARACDGPPLPRPSLKVVAAFGLPVFFVWAWFLLMFYPGTMNSDALIQWGQMKTFRFEPDHPPIYALVMWAGSLLWDSPSTTALLHILAGATLVGTGFGWLYVSGARRPLVLLLYGVVLLSPRNMTMIISLVKDTPYGLSMFCMAVALAMICGARGRAGLGVWAVAGLGFGLASIFRHNGPLMLAATLPLVVLVFYRQWRGVVLSVAILAAIFLTVKVGVYRNIVIDRGDGGLHDLVTSHLAILVDRDVPLTQAEYVFLDQVRDIEDRWAYDPRRVASTAQPYLPLYHKDWAKAHRQDYLALYRRLVLQNPLNAGVYFIERGNFIYVPWDRAGEMEAYFLGITSNDLGLSGFDIFLEWPGRIRTILSATARPELSWIFWRPAIPLFIVIIAGLVACLRQRNLAWALVYLPFLFNTGAIALAAISQAARYQFPVTFAAAFLVGVALLPVARGEASERPAGDGGTAN